MPMRYYQMSNGASVPPLTPPMSNHVNNYRLAAGVAKTVTWPDGAKYCVIAGDSPWKVAAIGSIAANPTTDITDGTGSAISPAQRTRGDENTFSVISPTLQTISIEFWG